MHSLKRSLVGSLLVTLVGCAATAPETAVGDAAADTAMAAPLRHELSVTVAPGAHGLLVEDRITLSALEAAARAGEVVFSLHAGLKPVSLDAELLPRDAGPPPDRFGINHTQEGKGRKAPLEHFAVTLAEGQRSFSVRYGGIITHAVQSAESEHARSFGDSPGLIEPEGVYLAGTSAWIPWLGERLTTFSMDVTLPPGWQSVSQGTRAQHDAGPDRTLTRWESNEPQDEVFLIAGQFHDYERETGGVTARAFFRQPEPALAEKYLDATQQYVAMYSQLLGPYPYDKFALVENFWETGYGMPSFTLLGPRVVRMPFILHSSYPHEILHNWWGNSVFVDYERGNWCEGLTAYLADHLIKEQRGQAAVHRRTALQRYSDYVGRNADFPIAEFRARHSPQTQAVGYDKTLMVFHMLRRRLGDELFVEGLRRLYAEKKYERASFDDIAAIYAELRDFGAEPFFDQWVKRAGAPELRLTDAKVELPRSRLPPEKRSYGVSISLEQVQQGPAFTLNVPVIVTLADSEEPVRLSIPMDTKKVTRSQVMPGPPLRVDVDPEFDIFRRLHALEVPPALSGALGEPKALYLLPSRAPKALRAAYRELVEAWRSRHEAVEVKLDSDVPELPADRAVWLLGWDNRHLGTLLNAAKAHGVEKHRDGLRIERATLKRGTHAAVLTARNPRADDQMLAWVGADRVAPMAGLARKLPHYGKYGYLGFEGDEPKNMAKGVWDVTGSPMSANLTQPVRPVAMAQLEKRRALASLPPVFNKVRMLRDLTWLADPARAGRGLGSAELVATGDWLADQFRAAGLRPAGDPDDGYFQSFKALVGEPGAEATLRNVVGVIPGSDPTLANKPVILGAHYDHLGLGWPDVHKGDEGKAHLGADDNASGVAVMLELARRLAKGGPMKRSVVFVAFSGEEAGLLGSQHYVASAKRYPAKNAIGMINLDTVGRLGEQKLTVFGTGTASEWVHIFFGAGYVSGVTTQPIADDIGGSDQKSFTDAGVPAVQLFSGAHLDYHRPADVATKIDADGLVKVAAVTREALTYLADRAEPLSSTLGGGGKSAGPAKHGGGRKVSLGTVPDFTFKGPGVKLTGTSPGSAAEAGGLRAGDIVLRVGEHVIGSLRDLGGALKKLNAGDRVTVVYRRGDTESSVDVTLKAR